MRLWTCALAAFLLVAGGARAAAGGYHVLDRIAGPDGGWDYVEVDTHGNRVLVTRGSSVMALDLGNRAVSTFATGQGLHDALPIAVGAQVLVTNGGTRTAVFYDAKGDQLASTPTGKGPDAAAFDASLGVALVDHAGGDITLIDVKTHEALGRIDVGGDLEAAAVDGAGRAFVNVEDKNEIAVIDLARKAVVAHWPLAGCDGPTGLAYDAADKLLIAACDGTTEVVDARSGNVLQTLATGKGADGVVFDTKQKLAFVPAGRAGTLSIIAVKAAGKSAIVDTVPTQVGARTIGLDPRTGRVYLPAAKYGPPVTAGGRPTILPGSFEVLVVGR